MAVAKTDVDNDFSAGQTIRLSEGGYLACVNQDGTVFQIFNDGTVRSPGFEIDPDGTFTTQGTITAPAVVVGNGASGSFQTPDAKTVTVENGIVTGIA